MCINDKKNLLTITKNDTGKIKRIIGYLPCCVCWIYLLKLFFLSNQTIREIYTYMKLIE